MMEHLPVIEDERSAFPRSTEEVAVRAMSLLVVSAKGAVRDEKLTQDLVARFAVGPDFTPKERAFIDAAAPEPQAYVNFSWRYESLNVLLWALGYVGVLVRPDRMVDVDAILPLLLRRPRERFIAEAQLRPMRELLDADDLIFRYHWATVDARLKRQPMPAGLNASVVFERHYALNWLVQESAWDAVDTST